MSSAVLDTTAKILAHHSAARNKTGWHKRSVADEKGDTITKTRIEIILEKHRVLTVRRHSR
jgi:hypothetical protein